MKAPLLEVDGQIVERDGQGYLLDPEQWDEDVAMALAAEEGIQLRKEHWRVLRFMRCYLDEYGMAADAAYLFDCMAKLSGEPDAVARQRFFSLFPYGYVKQACKIAGMRQPLDGSTV